MDSEKRADFERFVLELEPRLRRSLVAALGFENGREATANALAWAWEHWDSLQIIEQRLPYLYRVGLTTLRRRKTPVLFTRREDNEPWFEPSLGPALAALSERQRTAVVLVHGFGWTLREVAELTGVRVTTVQTHLERGLMHLRSKMEVVDNA
jgi:DNA-directed RNA polymerase specialized sigma24 family protein